MIKAYFSAFVRGHDGDNVSPEVKDANVREGMAIGLAIRKAFPELDLFIPHEHEVVVDKLWRLGFLSSSQIIKACCALVEEMDLLIVYTGRGISDGMQQEVEAARAKGVIVVCFDRWDDQAREDIANAIDFVSQNKAFS